MYNSRFSRREYLSMLGAGAAAAAALRALAAGGPEDRERRMKWWHEARFGRKGNDLYVFAHYRPGEALSIGGLQNRVKSVRLFVGNKSVKFDQDDFRLRVTGLPANAPDNPVTTQVLECDGEP